MQTLLGIDIGTSACKAALFDEDGRVLAAKSQAYPVNYPGPGMVEQDPEEWYRAVCRAVKALFEDGRHRPGDVAGVGIDGQSWSAIPVDASGKVLRDTPIWMDTRAQKLCGRINARMGEELFKVSGNPLQPAYTLPKILWYRENEPQVYEKTDKILQSNSFIAFRLTGAITQDLSQGYGLQCFDMEKGSWDQGILAELGLPVHLLPEIVPCHRIVGRVTAKAARETGLCEGTPVAAGGLDAACGTLGAGVISPGQTQEQGGQAGGMSICMDRPVADERLILGMHVVPGRWLLQGGSVGGGGALKWFEEQLGAFERAAARKNGSTSFEELSREAGEIPPGSEGVLFLPYMAGERSPIWNPDAKGVFFGLDYNKTRAHMARAVMEGVGYSLRHNLETARQAGARFHKLHAMGGAANSLTWTQLKSDLTGLPIAVPASDTATTLGAAILAGVGVGLYQGFEQAVQKTVSITREHAPNGENRAVYDRGFERYLGLYERLKDFMIQGEGPL